MKEKPSRLGRSLGDLLDDNTPEIKITGSVVRREHGEDRKDASTAKVKTTETEDVKSALANPSIVSNGAEQGSEPKKQTPDAPVSKALYEEQPRRSLKAVFRSFNKQ